MPFVREQDYLWLTLSRGKFMKKLNTYSLYSLALRINPLTTLVPTPGVTVNDLFHTVLMGQLAIQRQLHGGDTFFSPSIKRSARGLLEALYRVVPKAPKLHEVDYSSPVETSAIHTISHRAQEFETILANELPGLATYLVSPKGIYSTDDLISQAEMHVPEKCRELLNEKATTNIQQSGKCLAFELSTASSFHMWRAVECVMDLYHQSLTGKTFVEANIGRNWGQYIKALQEAKAEVKITTFLNHVREEYRNPITHPDADLELDEAFDLFSAGLSAVGQMLRTICELQDTGRDKMGGEPVLPAYLGNNGEELSDG